MSKIFITFSTLFLAIGAGLSMPAMGAMTDYYEVDDNAILHFHKAQRWMEVRQYEAAIRECQIAIRLKPSTLMTAAIYNNLGLAYLKAQDAPKAVISFQQAIALNPNFSLYYENLAKAYHKTGVLSSALQTLRQTTLTNPDNVQAWFMLGVMHKSMGDKASARQAFENYIRLAPHSELSDAAKLHLQY